MPDKTTAAVVLAAGDGKRMNSRGAKVCCEVLLKPMLSWVLDACAALGVARENTCVVLSDTPNGADKLVPDGMPTAVQAERRGTGHAVLCATDFLSAAAARGIRRIAVLCGDAPFIDPDALREALAHHIEAGHGVTVLSALFYDGGRYGRIVREHGQFVRIVEAADATMAELQIGEVNSGAYWFDVDYLLAALPQLSDDNVQQELYLTDLVALAPGLGRTAGAYTCPADTALGANSRAELARLNQKARDRVLERHLDAGVDIPLSDGVLIGPDVVIGRDTRILPGTILRGRVTVGEGCTLGPNTVIIDCAVGDDCVIDSSRLEKSRVGNGVRIGPFAQLRPDCTIEDFVKIGNFVEVKNSVVGEKTSLAHLTYIGDSDLGQRINMGCGVVTVNYDGVAKYRTVIDDGAFIGCNTNLIAPVRVGEGAYVAAASTVTEDVAPAALAIGRVKVVQKEGWAKTNKVKKAK